MTRPTCFGDSAVFCTDMVTRTISSDNAGLWSREGVAAGVNSSRGTVVNIGLWVPGRDRPQISPFDIWVMRACDSLYLRSRTSEELRIQPGTLYREMMMDPELSHIPADIYGKLYDSLRKLSSVYLTLTAPARGKGPSALTEGNVKERLLPVRVSSDIVTDHTSFLEICGPSAVYSFYASKLGQYSWVGRDWFVSDGRQMRTRDGLIREACIRRVLDAKEMMSRRKGKPLSVDTAKIARSLFPDASARRTRANTAIVTDMMDAVCTAAAKEKDVIGGHRKEDGSVVLLPLAERRNRRPEVADYGSKVAEYCTWVADYGRRVADYGTTVADCGIASAASILCISSDNACAGRVPPSCAGLPPAFNEAAVP
ncbi:MAG: hypothetical protein MJZ21_03155 [archaeon]|nr:hypothetical protein [archaeon]